MKTRNFIYVALAFMALSCAKEIAPETSAPEQDYNIIEKSFTAGIEATKTSMVDGFKIQWKANDGVTIIDNVAKKAVKYLAAETGAVSALNPAIAGTGVAEGATEIYAAYPWRDGDNALVLENGDELKNCYITQDQRPSVNNYYASAHYAMAKADKTDNLTFKNVNGFIRVTLGADLKGLVKAIYIFSNNDEEIAGMFKMRWNDGEPKAVYVSSSGNRTYVRAYNSNGSALGAGNYFLSIIPTVFEKGFTLVLQMMDGTQLSKRTDKNLTVAEGQILPMKALAKADYDTDYVNAYVQWNENKDVNIEGVVVNKTSHSVATLVTKLRNHYIGADGLFFVTPAAESVEIKNISANKWCVIGTDNKHRSPVTISSHLGVAAGGTTYLMANLNANFGGDCSLVRGDVASFGSIVVANCAFNVVPRTIFDMENSADDASMTLSRFVVKDSEFGINAAAVYLFSRRSKNMTLSEFTVENNIFYACDGVTMTDFKLINGYRSGVGYNVGVTINDYTMSWNTFVNTSGTSFVSVAGIEDVYTSNQNLFCMSMTQDREIVTIFQPGETLVVPQSGECINNYYYNASSNEYKWSKPSKYTGNLSRAGSPVKLSESPLSSIIWKPANGEFGAYSFKLAGEGTAPAYNQVGAQRADMVPATAALDSPAANYVSVELGSY